jgi:hypothetical protein
MGVSSVFGLNSRPDSASDFYDSDTGVYSQASRVRFQIERNFALKHSISSIQIERVVNRAIHEANPKEVGLNHYRSNSLSHDLVSVSQCYGIDPVVYAALIWRESNFKPKAESERGALGLAQLTHIGVREVLERLSPTSPRRLGHLRAVMKHCSPQLFEKIPYRANFESIATWRDASYQHPMMSLVTGALLLKLKLASHAFPAQQAKSYQVALERYNGDPKMKVQFARDVLLLSKRMTALPDSSFALNDSRFLSLIKNP